MHQLAIASSYIANYIRNYICWIWNYFVTVVCIKNGGTKKWSISTRAYTASNNALRRRGSGYARLTIYHADHEIKPIQAHCFSGIKCIRWHLYNEKRHQEKMLCLHIPKLAPGNCSYRNYYYY